MLSIAPDTFATLAAADDQRFVAHLNGYLRHHVPGVANEPPAALDAEVRRQIAAAKAFGLMSERAIATYVVAAAHLGPDFARRYPEAQTALTSNADGNAKAVALEMMTRTMFEALGSTAPGRDRSGAWR